eukprot:11220900-Lingulodinium_polyedra.AAC.2
MSGQMAALGLAWCLHRRPANRQVRGMAGAADDDWPDGRPGPRLVPAPKTGEPAGSSMTGAA